MKRNKPHAKMQMTAVAEEEAANSGEAATDSANFGFPERRSKWLRELPL
ncbi:hypothetical protein [Planomicrobium sp. CPCC 101110]|nr:hypothetical protein [Planomicrobium sp. CPCC 101110]